MDPLPRLVLISRLTGAISDCSTTQDTLKTSTRLRRLSFLSSSRLVPGQLLSSALPDPQSTLTSTSPHQHRPPKTSSPCLCQSSKNFRKPLFSRRPVYAVLIAYRSSSTATCERAAAAMRQSFVSITPDESRTFHPAQRFQSSSGLEESGLTASDTRGNDTCNEIKLLVIRAQLQKGYNQLLLQRSSRGRCREQWAPQRQRGQRGCCRPRRSRWIPQ